METVAAAGKPIAVVLMTGSALAVNWINDSSLGRIVSFSDTWQPASNLGSICTVSRFIGQVPKI